MCYRYRYSNISLISHSDIIVSIMAIYSPIGYLLGYYYL